MRNIYLLENAEGATEGTYSSLTSALIDLYTLLYPDFDRNSKFASHVLKMARKEVSRAGVFILDTVSVPKERIGAVSKHTPIF